MTTTPLAAQDRCPARADLKNGLRLIAKNPQHTRHFVQTDFGVLEKPVDPESRPTHFNDLPDWLSVGSPHSVLPGVFDGPKGKATVTYYLDGLWSDDPDVAIGAIFADLLDNMNVGQQRSFDVSVDQGTGRMLGFALWNRSGGSVEVAYLGPSAISPHKLGSCSYDIVTYRARLHAGGQSLLSEDVHYAPDLGLVLGRTPRNQDGTPGEAFWFLDYAYEDFFPGPIRCEENDPDRPAGGACPNSNDK